MSLCFSLSSVLICLLTTFICGSGQGKGLGGDLSMFAHTCRHANINQHTYTRCTQKRTSKRVPGIVTFHISFKSMRDYSPPVRKEERGEKTLIESISFKYLKDHLR